MAKKRRLISNKRKKSESPLPSRTSGIGIPKPATRSPKKSHRVLRTITNGIGMRLCEIPPGTFMMGSPKHEADRIATEETLHSVTITQAFWLGVYPVTQKQYTLIAGNNPSCHRGPSRPVDQVSWEDATAFCDLLSRLPKERQSGSVYRLPTEAQWEYSCRAGASTSYFFGDDAEELKKYAWFEGDEGEGTHPVGRKKPNQLGLYDMLGNVYEWCSDYYGRYPHKSQIDPVGPKRGKRRVIRGGSWYDGASLLRSAARDSSNPSDPNHDSSYEVSLGFRVVMVK